MVRTGTHLLHFAAYVDGLRGWGRGLRKAVGNWYAGKNDEQLAFQLAKYQNRDGWSHRDLLRLAHPMPDGEARKALYRWAVGAEDVPVESLTGLVAGLEQLKRAESESQVVGLIHCYQAPREVIPTQYLTSPMVWSALLPNLGITALLRNLGNLSKVGLLVRHAPVVSGDYRPHHRSPGAAPRAGSPAAGAGGVGYLPAGPRHARIGSVGGRSGSG